ncbi:MAG: MFS transporter [Defluviitaleaceae bacterium]|nr:MFS transporter [Defluviitaleaceae bacterium]
MRHSPPRFKKPNIKDIPAYIKGGFAHAGREISQLRGTNVWVFIMYGLLLDTVSNLWRPFAAVFLQRLGGGELEIALLNALPGAVAAVVLLPGAMLFKRFADRKRATAAFILISRALLLGIAMVPMLPAGVRPLMFVILVAIMNCPDALSQTSLQSFLGTVFGGTTRGQAIALRTKFGQAVVPVVTITTGLIITFIPRTDAQRMVLYQIFFVVAFIFGVLEVLVFRRFKVPAYATPQPDDGSPPAKPPSDWALFPAIIKDKRFRAFFIPALIFIFTWQAGWPLVAIHQVMVIQATELWFAIFALASGIAAFIAGGMWQRLLRKYGNDTVFIMSAVLLAVNMFFFPITPNVQLMAVLSLFTGISGVGTNVALFNGVLEATPDENRMMYLAFYNTATNISLFIAPFFAHALFGWIGNRNAMFIVGFMRGGATLLIWLVYKYRKKAPKEAQSE